MEVIHCRDCNFLRGWGNGQYECSKMGGYPVSSADYCSWAEPKPKKKEYVDKEELINKLKAGYWDKDLKNGKKDPYIINAMITWAIKQVNESTTITEKVKEK